MKQINWTKAKQMTATEIEDGPCLEVLKDGEHAFFIIVGAREEMRDQITARASMIDASRGNYGG